MNKTNHSPGKTKLRPLALGALAALLCSCAATSVKKTWKAPDAQPPAGKIAVLAIDERDWLRIDLLPASGQPAMRELFRQYLDSRLETYRKVPDMVAVKAELAHTARLQNEIWKVAMAGLLPALNQMFDIVTTRTMAAQAHPPVVVFLMLGVMAFAASFLAGHGMSLSKTRSWVHSLGFAGILALTVFVIMDMEYPRVGLIRVDSFDQVLVDLRQSMK